MKKELKVGEVYRNRVIVELRNEMVGYRFTGDAEDEEILWCKLATFKRYASQ